jgi:hypothetical protein
MSRSVCDISRAVPAQRPDEARKCDPSLARRMQNPNPSRHTAWSQKWPARGTEHDEHSEACGRAHRLGDILSSPVPENHRWRSFGLYSLDRTLPFTRKQRFHHYRDPSGLARVPRFDDLSSCSGGTPRRRMRQCKAKPSQVDPTGGRGETCPGRSGRHRRARRRPRRGEVPYRLERSPMDVLRRRRRLGTCDRF